MSFSVKRFIFENKFKKLTLLSYWYSAIYWFEVKFIKPSKLKKNWGIEGKESAETEEKANYLVAAHVAQTVGRICSKTKWESKCLVRALTAQKLLADKGIDSTLYLGCMEDENKKMVAHAWIRCGEAYVTGGNGAADGYAVVEKFRAGIKNE